MKLVGKIEVRKSIGISVRMLKIKTKDYLEGW
jgi:hypothetical protein